MRSVVLFSLRLGVLSLATACASTGGSKRGPVVDALSIEGADQLGESALKKRILTTETPWWEPFWPFQGPEYFDPNAWQADLRRIERYYQAEGYYQAQVLSNEVVALPKNQVELRARVREGEPTRIGEIAIAGLEALPREHREAALKDLPLVKGAVFREQDWDGVKDVIQGRLRELGYAEATVGGEVEVDVARHQATVNLKVVPGRRYRFGNIFAATDASPKVSPRRVIEQARGAVVKGEWYSESALAEAQARVSRMGVFGAVKVNRGAPDRAGGTVPVVVDVREAPFHSVRLGVGVGVDAFRQEARALAEYTDRNFFGGLRRLTLLARAGYAFIPSIYAVATRRENERSQSAPIVDLTAEFEQPRFLFRDLRLQTSLSVEKGLEQAFGFIGGRFRGGVIWQPHPNLSVFPSYNLEVYRLDGQVLTGERSPALTFGCRERATQSSQCDIALSYLEQTMEWDRRDDKVEPRDGFYAALALQEGGGPLQGSFTYLRLLPDVRYYQSFGTDRRLTVSGKLRMGSLLPIANRNVEGRGRVLSPIVSRFYSGGSFMRGFNSRRLSPLAAVPASDQGSRAGILAPAGTQKGQTVPIGGDGLFEGSLEVRYRLTQSVVGAAFYDTGFVTRKSFPLGDPGAIASNLQHAVGLGMRYLTPVGPIRLDLARRLNIGPPLLVEPPVGFDYPVERGCFGFGGGRKRSFAGSPEGICAFHLSIGEAF